jgi:hypothetical protein
VIRWKVDVSICDSKSRVEDVDGGRLPTTGEWTSTSTTLSFELVESLGIFQNKDLT